MKILHTADWHLGHNLYGYDRAYEQRAVLDAIADVVERLQPDALLVSGDIFDVPQPSAAAMQLLSDVLLDLHRRAPQTKLILTAGNHDSASRIDSMVDVWRLANVEFIGNRADIQMPERHIIELPGKGFIVAIPYVNTRFMPQGFVETILARVSERNSAGLPVVLMAHAAVDGSDPGSQLDYVGADTIGNIECVPLNDFGGGYTYLALGHIHRCQRVGERGMYSGSPLSFSFDDDGPHYLLEVNIDNLGATPAITQHALPDPRPLQTLPADASATWSEAIELLAQFPADREAYVRLMVTDDGNLPADARAQAARICADKKVRFCKVQLLRSRGSEAGISGAGLSVEELRESSPVELADLYMQRLGVPFDDEMRAIFAEASANVERNEAEGL